MENNPSDASYAEANAELAVLIERLRHEQSELALIEVLPRAKQLYEQLHPETQHGGDRTGQVRTLRTCPSFAKYVAANAGLSPSTIYRRLGDAEKLNTLDPAAKAALAGTPLTNQVRHLVRIAALPDPRDHIRLVNTFTATGGMRKMKAELRVLELASGLREPKQKKPQVAAPTVVETSSTSVDANAFPKDNAVGLQDAAGWKARNYDRLLEALGVEDIDVACCEIVRLQTATEYAENHLGWDGDPASDPGAATSQTEAATNSSPGPLPPPLDLANFSPNWGLPSCSDKLPAADAVLNSHARRRVAEVMQTGAPAHSVEGGSLIRAEFVRGEYVISEYRLHGRGWVRPPKARK